MEKNNPRAGSPATATSVPMKSVVSLTTAKGESLRKKIADIDIKLTEIRKLKAEVSPIKKHHPKPAPPKKVKNKLFHPKIEYVFGEVLSSPYMTKPLDSYPKTTYSIPEELRELRRQGYTSFKDIPSEKLPYDPVEIRSVYIKEVLNYHPNYLMTEVHSSGAPEPQSLSMASIFSNHLSMHASKSSQQSSGPRSKSPTSSIDRDRNRPTSSSGPAATACKDNRGERVRSPADATSMYSLFADSQSNANVSIPKGPNRYKPNKKNVRLSDGLKPPTRVSTAAAVVSDNRNQRDGRNSKHTDSQSKAGNIAESTFLTSGENGDGYETYKDNKIIQEETRNLGTITSVQMGGEKVGMVDGNGNASTSELYANESFEADKSLSYEADYNDEQFD